jgi:hypothetical protein
MFAFARPRAIRLALFTAVFGLFVWSCSSVPITGRKQLSLVPEGEIIAMASAQYDTFLMTNKLSSNKEQTAMIKRCGARIQKAVESYFASQNQSKQLEGYEWSSTWWRATMSTRGACRAARLFSTPGFFRYAKTRLESRWSWVTKSRMRWRGTETSA